MRHLFSHGLTELWHYIVKYSAFYFCQNIGLN